MKIKIGSKHASQSRSGCGVGVEGGDSGGNKVEKHGSCKAELNDAVHAIV